MAFYCMKNKGGNTLKMLTMAVSEWMGCLVIKIFLFVLLCFFLIFYNDYILLKLEFSLVNKQR